LTNGDGLKRKGRILKHLKHYFFLAMNRLMKQVGTALLLLAALGFVGLQIGPACQRIEQGSAQNRGVEELERLLLVQRGIPCETTAWK
jgi:hypothetical protein